MKKGFIGILIIFILVISIKIYYLENKTSELENHSLIVDELLSEILYLKEKVDKYEENSDKLSVEIEKIKNNSEKNFEKLKESISENNLSISNVREGLDYFFSPRTDERSELVLQAFYQSGLELKPQLIQYHDDYDLSGIKPFIYEWLDDSVFIYYFEDEVSLDKDVQKLDRMFHSDATFYKIIVNKSILIIYITVYDINDADNVNRAKENIQTIKTIVRNIDQLLE